MCIVQIQSVTQKSVELGGPPANDFSRMIRVALSSLLEVYRTIAQTRQIHVDLVSSENSSITNMDSGISTWKV